MRADESNSYLSLSQNHSTHIQASVLYVNAIQTRDLSDTTIAGFRAQYTNSVNRGNRTLDFREKRNDRDYETNHRS